MPDERAAFKGRKGSTDMKKGFRNSWQRALLAVAIALATVAATATVGQAASVKDKPLHWAKASFNGNDEAVEHITFRGATAAGQRTFIRWSVANAGRKKGKLTVTFLQQNAGGTLYSEQHFARGKYRVDVAKLGISAGGNVLKVIGGQVHMIFALPKVSGTAVLSSGRRGPVASDRHGGRWIRRELLSAWGQLKIDAKASDGRQCNVESTVFTVHEASNLKAHRVYDRSVQVHHVRGKRMRVLDYIVAPSERSHRPLGFVILRGGGSYVGLVNSEKRSAEKVDGKTDYQVPWRVDVSSSTKSKTAHLVVTAARQIKRKDDLAGLNWFVRKAVAMWMHPWTFTMRGDLQASVHSNSAAPSTVPSAAKPADQAKAAVPVKSLHPATDVQRFEVASKGIWKYAQTRK